MCPGGALFQNMELINNTLLNNTNLDNFDLHYSLDLCYPSPESCPVPDFTADVTYQYSLNLDTNGEAFYETEVLYSEEPCDCIF